jgi:4-hydroxy-tetrahydrodipicolinate synthase
MQNTEFRGIIAYPVTPFKGNGETVDTETLPRLIDQLIDNGAHAIAPLGSTGESAYLTDAEWEEVAEVAIKQVNQRVPTIIGISELTTQSAVRRAKFAEQVGANAIMVLPISYWKLSEVEVFQHYAAIAEAIGIPIMVYNNPATSGIDLSPELIARMVKEIDNLTMVKESSGDIQRMHRLYELSEGTIPF